MKMLFRDPPSAALRILVLAAVVSYLGVAATHFEGCFPHTGECLLLTPAVLVYWAPAFIAAWTVLAVLVKVVSPRQQVLPSMKLDSTREPALLHAKAEGGLSVAAGGFFCIGLQAITGAMTTRTTGRAHDAAAAADQFMHSRPGIALVLGIVSLAAYWALRRWQRPADNELG